jgi:hypothetical protein
MIKTAVPVAKPSAPKVAPAENKAAVKVLPSVQPMQLAADKEQQNSVESFFEPSPGKMAPSSPFQFKSTSSILPPNHSPIQRKSSSTWAFQPNSVGTNSNSTAPVQRAAAPANKTGLPDNVKSGVEQLSGVSLGDVKVHYNSPKPAQLQAHAYAQGTDIHVASGQEKHVPHEAWHVVQQKQGRVQATTQLKGTVPVNDDAGLEMEADVMGAKAVAQGKLINNIPKSDTAISMAVAQRVVVQLAYSKSQRRGVNAAISGDKVEAEVNDKPEEGAEVLSDTLTGETALDIGDAKNELAEPGVAGVITSVGSLYGLYIHAANAKANWKESDLSEKLGLGVEVVEAGGKLAANIAGTVEEFQGEEAGEDAGIANKVGMGFAEGLSALKTGVMTIYEVYKTYKLYKSDVEASKGEKVEAGVNIIKGLLTTAGKAVSSIKSIAEMLNQGSVGLATAVPGIGLALNAVDIAVGVYDIIKAHHSANEMQAIITSTKAANAQADVKVLEHLKKINSDKVKNLGVNMALDFVALAGNIAACIPEPNSQIAGLSLKIIAGGGKLLVSFFNSMKGMANDKAAANPDSTFGKLFGNKENSSGEIKKRNIATVHFIASHINAVDPNDENAIKTNKEKVDPIIQAAGTDPQAFYREVKTKTFNDGMVLIYKNMA